ncbi:MAG: hypothetical protein BWK79_18210 [Beggiatoa sp. IS2]|nr:MAG: hypothetical protein BWK79_18210 [Beggiatoa sp. IS2]
MKTRLAKSLTDQLVAHETKLSAKKVNQILIELELLEEKTRPSSKGGFKNYKALTETGKEFGFNAANFMKPEETQPRYYNDTFPQLLEKVNAWLQAHQ